ncbi:MAG TPA: DUF5995 family protein [Acidimicrobiales bacterium]|nr:DUF5995 family protein [Acidimicrobiales bacterium]
MSLTAATADTRLPDRCPTSTKGEASGDTQEEGRELRHSVLILGGGVAGLSAAHELAERDFAVTVVEAREHLGGKARSFAVPGSAVGGRRSLPAEHGFRFFPGFYRHLPDTMRRIPYGDQPNGVLDNLREATQMEIARSGGLTPVELPAHFPDSVHDLRLLLHTALHPVAQLSPADYAYFASRLLLLLTSCQERRYVEWDNVSWWEFSGAPHRSAAYQQFMADGLTRTLVAARARQMSARTGGYILLQLLFDLATPGRPVDRVLDGPTSDVWISPWQAHLESLGVRFELGVQVEAIEIHAGRVAGVAVADAAGRRRVEADWYVAAVPVEHMTRLTNEAMKQAEPALDRLPQLVTRWMNGIVFYLRKDAPMVHGHVIYIDSPWSLTSISQEQFWDGFPSADMGAGDVGGLLSVDISEWQTPGLLTGKTAMDCSREEIAADVLAQLRAHLAPSNPEALDDANVVSWFLDEDVRFPEVRKEHGVRTDINLEPLLVNTPGSWRCRPKATTAIPNLFLASDYVRTFTDLATMEGANEAARRAVNGIVAASGSNEPRCGVWPLREPAVFAPARALDSVRFKLERRVSKAPAVPAPISRSPSTGAPVGTTIGDVIARMEEIDGSLPPTDGVACFNRMYLDVTKQVQDHLATSFFSNPAFMEHLDVVFADIYFAALDASTGGLKSVPAAWEPLFELRSTAGIYPIQFALAGMNAHINHDLPIAVVQACTDFALAPDQGSIHDDYQKVDGLLDAIEQSIRQSFESSVVLDADRHAQRALDLIGNWSITSARDVAWDTALALWQSRGVPTVEDLMMNGLARTVAMASRCLLVEP